MASVHICILCMKCLISEESSFKALTHIKTLAVDLRCVLMCFDKMTASFTYRATSVKHTTYHKIKHMNFPLKTVSWKTLQPELETSISEINYQSYKTHAYCFQLGYRTLSTVLVPNLTESTYRNKPHFHSMLLNITIPVQLVQQDGLRFSYEWNI